ncbi:hypothetical protein IWQ61_001648 [Dispira simplex]|nr:hypothetical protein IWQ61_001648 [Dispira simplex]
MPDTMVDLPTHPLNKTSVTKVPIQTQRRRIKPEDLYPLASRAFLLRHHAQAWNLCCSGLALALSPTSPNAHTPPELLLPLTLGPVSDSHHVFSNSKSSLPVLQRWWVLYLTLLGALLEANEVGQLQALAAFRDALLPCTSGITQPWLAYTTIGQEGFLYPFPTHLDQVWQALVEAYQGEVYRLPGEVVVAAGLLALQFRLPRKAAHWVETWFAGLPDTVLDLLEGSDLTRRNDWYRTYEQVAELYLLQILPSVKEWSSAKAFLEYNQILEPDTRRAFIHRIQRLQRNQRLADKRARVRKQQRVMQTPYSNTTLANGGKVNALSGVPSPPEEVELSGNGVVNPKQVARVKVETSTEEYYRQRGRTTDPAVILSQPLPHTTVSPSAKVDTPNDNSHSEEQTLRLNQTSLRQRPLYTIKKYLHRLLVNQGHFLIPLLVAIVLMMCWRSLRQRFPRLLRTLGSKLWQTLVMGTRTTYL